ncbi:MAG: hypothetical protein MJ247_07320 [Alphaproteobacteria bacterium]|nr:hypothetical protein [Alphaproteobacteria bacterium]
MKISPITTGMHNAVVSFNRSAQNIASVMAVEPVSYNNQDNYETPEIPVNQISAMSGVNDVPNAFVANETILEQEAVNMQIASSVFKAGIAAYKTANEMNDELLSIV